MLEKWVQDDKRTCYIDLHEMEIAQIHCMFFFKGMNNSLSAISLRSNQPLYGNETKGMLRRSWREKFSTKQRKCSAFKM